MRLNPLIVNDKPATAAAVKCERHSWSAWKDVGRTGDWFKPVIVERHCTKCGATESDEH